MTTQQSQSWQVEARASAAKLEIAVHDVIGQSFFGDGITSKGMLATLRSAPAAKEIDLRVNSVGGIVDEAKGMINLLGERASSGVKITGYVDGIAASAASYLLTAAHRVVMPSNSFQMLHQVRAGMFGTADELEAHAVLARRLNVQLAEAYAAASERRGKSKTKEDYLALFAQGDTYLDADEAIEWGLADEKLEPLKAAACLVDLGEFKTAPDVLRAAPYVARAQAQQVTPQPDQRVSEASAKTKTAAGGERKIQMTEDDFKSQHSELYAAVFNRGLASGRTEGATKERERIEAHLTMGESCGSMPLAIDAIKAGTAFDHAPTMAKYHAAAAKQNAIAARQQDSDDTAAALAGVEQNITTAPSTLDQVVATMGL